MRKGKPSSTPSPKIRVRRVEMLPPLVMNLLVDLNCQSTLRGRFEIEGLPITVNHMFFHRGNKRILSPEARTFREMVAWKLGALKSTWKPKGPVAIVILLFSPYWITKEHRVRVMDVDNRIKPLIDAVKEATSMPDELCWQVSAFKVASKHEKTVVHMFELGDVVDYYQGN